ncbi:MAG: hypothetical protein ABWZ99_10035 [Ilumatobacteraceae bacterium]
MSQTPKDIAQAAVDGDQLITAGVFQARGATFKMMMGAGAGGSVGDIAGGALGDAIGFGVGMLAGTAAGGEDGVFHWLVAVSPTRVYVFEPVGGRRTPGGQVTEIRHGDIRLIYAFERSQLEVTVKSRVNVRVLILEDLPTGEKMELEGNRLGWSHAKDVVTALVAHDHED